MKRLVALIFTLSLLAAPAAWPYGQNKIVYDRFDWKIYPSTHFDVYFYEEERDHLQRVVDSAETAYLDLSQKFNYQIPEKIPLIFYHTHSAFEQTNVMLNFIPEGVGAFAEPVRKRMVLPVDMPDDKLLQLIQHELTHIFEYEVLFQGKLTKTVTADPPQWFMEGLASFMAQDEESRDRMVLRDAVVNDQIPRITMNPRGYFAYRFGHSVFKYMQEQYGWEGLRDFLYEYRNTLGSTVDKALKRAFNVTPEEFDTRFRTWLRKQYLPALVAKGEPQEYGDPFRIGVNARSAEISPIPSPSGDLLAGIATYKEDVDVVIFNIPERKMMKNITAGYTSRYEYPIVQSFTTAPVMGRDLAWSPNGDYVALFAKKERGRNLLLIDTITGEIARSIAMPIEQQLAPTFSPDGKSVAFSGIRDNQPDIFLYDLGSGEITNLTSDAFYDGAPTFSPDGKWLVYSSVSESNAKLYRLNLADPRERYQLTTGEWNDIDPVFTPDGKRIFFASDKQTGRNIAEAAKILEQAENEAKRETDTPPPDPTNFAAYNIYSLDLATGDLLQYTDVIGGCFTPSVFTGANNRERLVFSSYYKGDWKLFSTTTDRPLRKAEKTTIPSAPITAEARPMFKTSSEFFIDEEKIQDTGGFRLFVDDVDVAAGISSDQLVLSRSVIFMSDMLGNRRFVAALDSVQDYSNFDFLYYDLSRRMNWGARVFDNRSFFVAPMFNYGGQLVDVDRRQVYRETGAMGLVSYPFNRYHRVDAGAGFVMRDGWFPQFVQQDGEIGYYFYQRKDKYPVVSSTFTGDTAIYKYFGPVAGRRYEATVSYAPDLDEGGSLSTDFNLDFRQYYQVSSRTSLAARIFAAVSEGNAPNIYYFGGLNTLRGYDFRTLIGNRAGFANFEFRFPLIDAIITPIINLQAIRGNIFMDIGASNFSDQPFEFVRDGRLKDGKASIGWGFAVNLMGMEMHWDFAKRFDLKDTYGGVLTSFWIGQTF